ncbi:MAG: DnaD domain-containing protein [Brevefilum sp.]
MAQQPSPPFNGFPDDDPATIRVPQAFFTHGLRQIDNLQQLRLLLYFFWQAEAQQGILHHVRWEDLAADPALVEMIGDEDGLRHALQELVNQGWLISAEIEYLAETNYFLNTPQGRAAVQAIESGQWQRSQQNRQPIHLPDETPNIFKLYEENIGVITPMMADILKEDEKTYPASWIREAIQIAVARNVRTWKYVQGILKRWQKEGRDNEQNRRDNSQDPERYRRRWLKRD